MTSILVLMAFCCLWLRLIINYTDTFLSVALLIRMVWNLRLGAHKEKENECVEQQAHHILISVSNERWNIVSISIGNELVQNKLETGYRSQLLEFRQRWAFQKKWLST